MTFLASKDSARMLYADLLSNLNQYSLFACCGNKQKIKAVVNRK